MAAVCARQSRRRLSESGIRKEQSGRSARIIGDGSNGGEAIQVIPKSDPPVERMPGGLGSCLESWQARRPCLPHFPTGPVRKALERVQSRWSCAGRGIRDRLPPPAGASDEGPGPPDHLTIWRRIQARARWT